MRRAAQQMDGSPQPGTASASPQSQNHRISQIGRDPQGSLTPASSQDQWKIPSPRDVGAETH